MPDDFKQRRRAPEGMPDDFKQRRRAPEGMPDDFKQRRRVPEGMPDDFHPGLKKEAVSEKCSPPRQMFRQTERMKTQTGC